jgi:sRNA-binding regulator protein Hfq
MKDSMDATAVGRAIEPEVFANRKLIRPALNRNDHPRQDAERRQDGDRRERPERASSNGKKKQMQSKTPMVLVLQDGEEVHGVIEWYDKYCLKVNRTSGSNLLIYKPSIKYMFKESEAGQRK